MKQNDSLVINGEIVIELVAIGDDTVRLSCLVPREVPVARKETSEAIDTATARERDRHD
jgi:carbon storage regulator CsrA